MSNVSFSTAGKNGHVVVAEISNGDHNFASTEVMNALADGLEEATAKGARAAVVCAGGLAACSGSDATDKTAPVPSRSGSGEILAQVADIKVGGAISAKSPAGQPIIIAQPKDGTFVGFSAICTHAGCTVVPSADGKTLQCPCHKSTFDALTGKNTGGPAPAPLPKVLVEVKGGAVVAV